MDPGGEGALGKPAVGSGNDIFPAYQPGVDRQALGHQLGMLYQVGGVGYHPRDEDLSVGEFNIFSDLPFMLVPGVCGLHAICTGANLQHDIDDVL